MKDYEREAARWIDAHAAAWDLLKTLARERVLTGRRFGMKALIERARWDAPGDLFDGGSYKLNNNHTAYLARALCREIPAARRYIEMRRAGGEPYTAANDDAYSRQVTA